MKMNVWTRALGLTSVVTGAALTAAPGDLDSRVSQLEKQMTQVRTTNANDTFGALTGSARPETSFGVDFNIQALYWRPYVAGTEYVYTSDVALGEGPSATCLPVNGDVKSAHFNFDWGLRVGAGYNLGHDGWQVAAQYTYFKSVGSDSQEIGLEGDLYQVRAATGLLMPIFNFFIVSDKASTDVRTHFQNLDLVLGRNFFVSQDLALMPFAGVQSSWINISQDTTYSNGVQLAGNAVFLEEESKFWGMGPEVGVNTKWCVGKGFSLFANVAGSLLYGNVEVENDSTYSLVNDDPTYVNYMYLNADDHVFIPMTKIQLGLGYEVYTDDRSQHFAVNLGYETQYWFDAKQRIAYNDRGGSFTSSPGIYVDSTNVAVQGVTLEFRWDF